MKNHKQKRYIPIITGFALLIVMALIAVPLINLPTSPNNSTSSSDRATLDQYQGEFIGNNSAMSDITNLILYNYELDGISLQTKKEPFGVTVNTLEEIPEHMRLKYAVYVFSLIDNADFVEIAEKNITYIIERTTLEQTRNVDFAMIEGDDNIMQTYYEMLAATIPQLQTKRDDAYKVVVNALQTNSIVSDWQTNDAPEFSFKVDNKQYLAWKNPSNEETSSYYIVDIENPSQAILVTNDAYEKLAQFTSSDYELVTGKVVDIVDNQLLVTPKESDIGYLVSVDNVNDYAVDDSLTIWSTRATFSIPAQATATKVQKH